MLCSVVFTKYFLNGKHLVKNSQLSLLFYLTKKNYKIYFKAIYMRRNKIKSEWWVFKKVFTIYYVLSLFVLIFIKIFFVSRGKTKEKSRTYNLRSLLYGFFLAEFELGCDVQSFSDGKDGQHGELLRDVAWQLAKLGQIPWLSVYGDEPLNAKPPATPGWKILIFLTKAKNENQWWVTLVTTTVWKIR